LCEVESAKAAAFEQALQDIPHSKIGAVTTEHRLIMSDGDQHWIDADIDELKEAWKTGLNP
jgi:hypothetical protein